MAPVDAHDDLVCCLMSSFKIRIYIPCPLPFYLPVGLPPQRVRMEQAAPPKQHGRDGCSGDVRAFVWALVVRDWLVSHGRMDQFNSMEALPRNPLLTFSRYVQLAIEDAAVVISTRVGTNR